MGKATELVSRNWWKYVIFLFLQAEGSKSLYNVQN